MSEFYDISVPMKPEMEKAAVINDDNEGTFEIPEIFYQGFADTNEEEPMFDWRVDSVFVKRGNRIVRYDDISWFDVLIKSDNGETVLENGKGLEILGCSSDEVIDFRPAKEYRIDEYDLEKSLKRRYKVVLEETLDMSEHDIREINSIIDDKNNN